MEQRREFRRSDAAAVARLWLKTAENEGFDPFSTLARLPSAEDIASRASDADSAVVVMQGEHLVAYGDVRHWKERNGLYVYLLSFVVDPSVCDQAFESSLLGDLEAAAVSQHGDTDAPAVFGTSATSTNVSRWTSLQSRGYQNAFSMVELQLRLDDHAGTLLREIVAENRSDVAIRCPRQGELHLLQRLNALAYEQRDFVAVDTGETLEEFVNGAGDLQLWRCAWNDDEPVAFVSVVRREAFAEVLEVSVHPGWRRRGLARRLLAEILVDLHGQELPIVRLHTNGEDVSGALSLYKGLAFDEIRTHYRLRRPLTPV